MPFVEPPRSALESGFETLLTRDGVALPVAEDDALPTLFAEAEAALARIERLEARLELATAPRRYRMIREALRRGEVGLYRALQVASETRSLPDEVVDDIATTVLAPAPDGSTASQRLFSSRLRRWSGRPTTAGRANGGVPRRHRGRHTAG